MIARKPAYRPMSWRLILIMPVAAAFVHVGATLIRQNDLSASAFERLAPQLPVNKFKALAPVMPTTAPLPFMNPAFHYAICRFDSRNGPVALSVTLADAGWNLTVYDAGGASLHASNGIPDRPLDIAMTMQPAQDRFFGLELDAVAVAGDPERPRLRVTADNGLAVLRAPDRGIAYSDETKRQLATAFCAPETQPR